MTADGDRVAGEPAGDATDRDWAPDDRDAPLADLTAEGETPLEDLVAPPDGGDGLSGPLPDLTARRDVSEHPAGPDDPDDDWAPAPPAAADGRSRSAADGLPPGALGAGASGVGLPDPAQRPGRRGDEDGRRPGRAGGRRRARRGMAPAENGADGASGAAAVPARPLTAEERLQEALTLAYRHLSKRDRTVSEVRGHLEQREVDQASIAAALTELVDFGYVDDERYATRFVEDKRRLEGWGHLRIEQGLRRTGIPREIADRALADDPLRGEEDELAVDALERRLHGRALEDDRARQRALRLLSTKGYALETSYAAVRAYERRCAERDDA